MINKIFGERIEDVSYYERLGVYAIIIKDNKIATVKTPKGNFLIGGGIEDRETHEECIVRESLEETGSEVEVKDYICKSETYCFSKGLNRYFNPICYYYFTEIKDKVIEPIENDHKFEWISANEIEYKITLEHQKWAINQAMNNIILAK